MPSLQALQELALKITGDASSYVKSLFKAKDKTEESSNQIGNSIDDLSKKIDKALAQVGQQYETVAQKNETWLDKLGKTTFNINNIVESANKLNSALNKMTGGFSFWEQFNTFAVQSKAENTLTTAIESQGREIGSLLDNYKQWASEIQKVTTSGDELNLQLAQQTLSFGLTDQQTKRAVRNAIALAEATDRSTRETIKATIRLEAGSTEMLQEYIPSLIGTKDATERVAKAQATLNNMWAIAEKTAASNKGQLDQLNNSWGDFRESFGEIADKYIAPFIQIAKHLVDELQNIPKPVKEVVVVFGLLQVVAATLTTTLLTLGGATIALVKFVAIRKVFGVFIRTMNAFVIIGAAVAATLALVTISVVRLIDKLGGFSEAVKQNEIVLDKMKQNTEKWAESYINATGDIQKEVNKFNTSLEKRIALESLVQNATNEMKMYENNVQAAQERVDNLNSLWKRWTGNQQLKIANVELEDQKKRLETVRTRVDSLGEAYKQVQFATLGEEELARINNLTQELIKQSTELRNSSIEAKIYDLDLRLLGDEALNTARAIREMNLMLDQSNRIVAKAENLIESLKENRIDIQIEPLGMSKYEKDLYKLDNQITLLKENLKDIQNQQILIDVDKAKQRIIEIQKLIEDNKVKMTVDFALNRENIQKEFDTLTKQIQLKDTETKLKFDVERISGLRDQIAGLSTIARIEEKRNQLLKEGAELTRKYMTPFEKYNEEVDNLRLLLASGAVSTETFNRAMEDANKQLEDAEIHARKTREELQRLNAVKYGSAEAIQRFEDYRDKLKQQFEEMKRLEEMKKKIEKPVATAIEQGAIQATQKFTNEQANKAYNDLISPFRNTLPPDFKRIPILGKLSNKDIRNGPEGYGMQKFNSILPSVSDLYGTPLFGGDQTNPNERLKYYPKTTTKEFPVIPKFTPRIEPIFPSAGMGAISPRSEFNVTSKANSEFANDSKETNRLLSEINDKLGLIQKKPETVLGVTNINK